MLFCTPILMVTHITCVDYRAFQDLQLVVRIKVYPKAITVNSDSNTLLYCFCDLSRVR